MATLSLEDVYHLLETRQLPGNPDQLARLTIRISELVEINGPRWVRRHRQQLLDEWQFILDHQIC